MLELSLQQGLLLEGRYCVTHIPSLVDKTCLAYAQHVESSKQQVGFVIAPVTPALSSPHLGHSRGEAHGESGVCLYASFSFEKKRSVGKMTPPIDFYTISLLING